MKTLFLALGLVFITSISLFSATEQEIITKLKEIDKAMMQGSISYKNTKLNEKNETTWSAKSFIYDSKGRSKSTREIIQPDNTKEYMLHYVDDKYYFFTSTRDNSIAISNRVTNDTAMLINQSIFDTISASPSLRYGRGLTLFENLKIDPINNIATGDMGNFEIIAYLDPKLDYAAYKLKRDVKLDIYGSDPLIESDTNNSKPILVDGKYYIFSKSTRTYIDPKTRGTEKSDYEIISATFKTPNEKDYIFDWSKNTFENIVDARVDNKLIQYRKSELPNGITLEELLKMTEKRYSWQLPAYFWRQITPLIAVVVGALCLIILFVFISRKRNKKRNGNV